MALLGDLSDDSVVNKLPKDEEWNIINSLYYCSSLYTTVGETTPISHFGTLVDLTDDCRGYDWEDDLVSSRTQGLDFVRGN